MIFVFVIPVQLLILYLYVNDIGDRPINTGGFVLINIILVLTYLLLYGLTTTVTPERLTVSFGIGLIRKTIALSSIKTITVVTNSWYYGWGLRFIPNGMMYNISGFKAIELSLTDSGRVVRIGSRQPEKLKEEIEKRLRRSYT